jgi:hypothetical protein
MKIIKSNLFCVIALCAYMYLSNSCNKSSSGSTIITDTVKLEAIFKAAVGSWYVQGIFPTDIGTDTSIAESIIVGNWGEACDTPTFEALYYVQRYPNDYAWAVLYASTGNTPALPDTAVVLNIYVNGKVVASHAGKNIDSVKYFIH